MADPVTRLAQALKAAGINVGGVSPIDGGGYRVFPPELQAAAQPIIDAFNPNDPAHVTAEKDAEIENLKPFRALAKATHELKTNAWTFPQYWDRVRAIYRGL